MTPRNLALAGAALLVVSVILAVVLPHRGKHHAAPPLPTTTTAPPPTTSAPAPTTTAPPPPPPKPIPMSWENAGALVWHTGDVDPDWLGQQLRSAGFGWVGVYFDAGDPPDLSWIERLERAGGLAVGGWSVLGDDPHADAALAARSVRQNGFSFYIADAENPYQTDPNRSQEFVTDFRALEPTLHAGLSSFCDANGIGLAPWANAGFEFLPQAYVNDFGAAVSPAACARAASGYFPLSKVHPTVGSYHGLKGWVAPGRYIPLLAQAGTTGFSVYLAETNMTAEGWQSYGQAIKSLHIAARAS
jgi:hypothetical protein